MLGVLRVLVATVVVSTYFAAAPFGYAAFAVLQLVPTPDPEARARLLQRVVQRAFTFMHAVLRWLGLIDFDPRALEGSVPSEPCVVVANHPTLTDTSAVISSLGHISCAVKPALFRRFWARPLLEQAGHFASSTSSSGVPQMMHDALDRLARGHRVLMFPEGTRSPAEGTHRFGRTPFEIAVRAGVPVVPVVIECAPRWLAKGQSLLRPPREAARLRLRALPPIHPDNAGSCSRTLRDMVRGAILSQLDDTSLPQ